MKTEKQISLTVLALLMLPSLVPLLAGCRRIETDHPPKAATLALVYSANVMGEIAPCG